MSNPILDQLRQRAESTEAAGQSAGMKLFAFLGVMTMHTIGVILRLWGLVRLWTWFVMPLHPGIPQIGMLWFWGLILVYSLFKFNPDRQKPADLDEYREHRWFRAWLAVSVPALVLLTGWIIHKCI